MMKKRLLSALLCLAMLLTLMPSFVFAEGDTAAEETSENAETQEPSETTGTEESGEAADTDGSDVTADLVISTVDDLKAFAALVKNGDTFSEKTVVLKNDIEVNDYWYDNVSGVNHRIDKDFAGTFDGQGFAIKGLKFQNTNISQNPNMYLFTSISGTVKNLTLDGVDADINDRDCFGFIAYKLTGTAENCHVKNVTVDVAVNASGIGYMYASGAMFGTINSATVSSCTAEGVTFRPTGTDNSDNVGSLIGIAGGSAEARSTIKNCSVKDITYDCTQKTKRTGGFVGQTSYTDVIDCTATNINIHVDSYAQSVGGFVGNASSGSVFNNCSVIGFKISNDEGVSFPGDVGGFCSYASGGDIQFTDCSVSGLDMDLTCNDLKYDWAAGGFIGFVNANINIDNCSVSGSITVTGVSERHTAGGLIGTLDWYSNKNINIDEANVSVDITAENSTTGGLIGEASASKGNTLTATDCTVSGTINSESNDTGSFVGKGDNNSGIDQSNQFNGSLAGAAGNNGNIYHKDLQTIIDQAQDGDVITLARDVTISSTIIVTKKLTLDLNGHTIKNTTALWNTEKKNWSLISVRGGELTITGEGNLEALADDCYAVDVQGGKLIINGGNYLGNLTTVYVKEGEAVINGGRFDMTQLNEQGNKGLLINCYDASFKEGTAKITITGGEFAGFNPSCNAAEGKHTVFTPDGYIGKETNGVYTIVEGTNIVIDEAVATTCTESGLTEGSHCAVCGEVLVAQETVPSLGGHTEAEAVAENEVEASPNQSGSYDSVVYCSVCGEELSRETLMSPDRLPLKLGFVRSYNEAEGKYYITLIAGIDSLDYDEVGFIVTVGDRTETFTITKVYTSVKVNQDDEIVTLTAADFSTDEVTATHIFGQAISFSDVSENSLSYQIYTKQADGTVIYGQVYETEIAKK